MNMLTNKGSTQEEKTINGPGMMSKPMKKQKQTRVEKE